MKYKKATIKTKPEAEDIISAELMEAGITGLEIEDAVPWSQKELDEIFVDEVPLKPIPEDEAYISFYLEENDQAEELLKAAANALKEAGKYTDIGEGSICLSSEDDADWLNKWKDYFRAFSIQLHDGRSLRIVPSWEEETDEEKADILLHIDPGTAFGTGAHETTQLCIRELSEKVRPGMKVLDLGCGSGILSMVSFLFGASAVTATDVDPNAENAVRDNFRKNGLEKSDFKLVTGDVITDMKAREEAAGEYDLIVANILPSVLIPLTPVMKYFLKPGGIVIFSGILEEKAAAVRDVLEENGYRPTGTAQMGEWVMISAVREK